MKRILCILAFFATSSLMGNGFSKLGDQQILDVLGSKEFVNREIQYFYKGTTYPIYVVHNPKKETLLAQSDDTLVTKPLIVSAHLPLKLVHHLEEKMFQNVASGAFVDLRGIKEFNRSYLQTLTPVRIGETFDAFDEEIRAIFASEDFRNEVFYFRTSAGVARIRILHNPKAETKTVESVARLFGKVRTVSVSWDYKYGIMSHVPVPNEVMDHLSSLVECSTWDWYMHFDVKNGTKVEASETEGNIQYIYSFDTWFFFAEDF